MKCEIVPLLPGLRSLCRNSDGNNVTLPIVVMRMAVGGIVYYFEPSGNIAAAVLFPEGLVYAPTIGYFSCEESYWAAVDGQK